MALFDSLMRKIGIARIFCPPMPTLVMDDTDRNLTDVGDISGLGGKHLGESLRERVGSALWRSF